MSRIGELAPILDASAGNGAGDLNRKEWAMRKLTWLAVLAVAILSVGAAWAESRACDPPTCDPSHCVPSNCAK
jgi:hypothetical protein